MQQSLRNSITNVSVTVLIVILLKKAVAFPTMIILNLLQFIFSFFHFGFLSELVGLVSGYGTYALTLGISVIIAKLIFKTPQNVVFPFHKTDSEYTMLAVAHGVSMGFIINLMIVLLVLLFSMLHIQFLLPPANDYNSMFSLIADSVLAGILPAFLEEMLFRGVILQSLRKHSNNIAILFSAIAFALCHNSFPQALFAFCMGVIFAVMTIRTGSLLPSIITHAIYNFTASLISGLLARSSGNMAIVVDATIYILFVAVAIISYLKIKDKYGSIYWYPQCEEKITSDERKEIFSSIPFIIVLILCFVLFIKGVRIGVFG